MGNTKKPVSLIKRACDFCRQRKIKCSGKLACDQCLRLNRGNCTYNIPALKRGPKRSRTGKENKALPHTGLGHVPSNTLSSSASPRMCNFPDVSTNAVPLEVNNFSLEHASDFQINSTLSTSYSSSGHTRNDSVFCPSIQSSIVDSTTNYSYPHIELNSIFNRPISEDGFDFVKLVLFPKNRPENRMEVDQVTSIVNYFMNLHSCVPILDPNYFLHHLTKPHHPELKVLLYNIIALQCLSEIDMNLTVSVFQKIWNHSRNPILYDVNSPTFYSTLSVLDNTIYHLASILL